MKPSLFIQLFKTKVGIILMCFLPLIGFGIFQINSIYYSKAKSNLIDKAFIIKQPVINYLNNNQIQDLQNWITTVKTSSRITIINQDGIVLADNKADPSTMNNHKMRPEIIQAFEGKTGFYIRDSFTLKKELMYVAIQIKDKSDTPYIIRTSLFLDLLSKTVSNTVINLILLSIILIGLAGFISYLRALKITRPLNILRRATEQIAEGNFSAKVPISENSEFAPVAEAMNKMMIQLADRIRTITRERNEKEQILFNMTDGIFLLDNMSTIKSINPTLAKMTGIPMEHAINKPIESIRLDSALKTFIQKSIQTKETIEDIVSLKESDGMTSFFHIHGTPILGKGNSRYGTLIMMNDVTQIRRLEGLRQEFIANVSHELKTPITLIKGFTETLLDGAIDNKEDAIRFISIIENHTGRIESIIDNLMQLSKLEKDGSGINKEEIVVDQLIESSILAVRNYAETSKVTINYLPNSIRIYGNQRLLEQAIINFLSNAIRYSSPDHVIDIRCEQKNKMVWISVQDYGCGISETHLPKLFQRFYRVDQARSRQGGGTGLGLAIVKHIVQSHGGNVSVKSKVNKGSTFTIALPDQYH